MFDLVVIGTGAGLTVAEAAAKQGLEVAIVEKGKFGGTCLTRGCIPSKMLVYPADMIREAERAHKVGLTYDKPRVDWGLISRRMWDRINVSQDIEETFSNIPNVVCFKGEGFFTDEHTMRVRLNAGGEAELKGKKFLIAAGAYTRVPPVKGLEEAGYITSESFFGDSFPEKPWKSLIISGSGTIAMEFAHIFAAFGTKVTVMGRNPRLLPQEEPEISDMLRWQMKESGVTLHTGFEVVAVETTPEGKLVTARSRQTGEEVTAVGEELMIASGVVPATPSLHVDKAGVETDADGWIIADEYLQTSRPHIYALGDILGGDLFRHKANYEADILINNWFHPDAPKRAADYRAIPWAIFTMPQIGHVGMTEEQVRKAGIRYHVGRYRYSYIAAGMAMGYEDDDGDNGLVKLLLDENKRILGIHIAGFQASSLVQPFVYLMNAGDPLKDAEAGTLLPLMRSMVIHPSLSELSAWSIENIDWSKPIDPRAEGQ